ncbi:tetratricopeptide repeat protein [Xiashengella succiniciproducens]|jgi:tetratricopeptide (TPR) repeat protein|uniref:Tetratricopeptide repeat protein n=1 Tax=Xiashengella succiniciproducens TaxID=2949635 RepID=A0A9J6ZLF2_9BACT|nr:tetratricopeptide repeat protein [Alkaliflexus sp. Ai-910]MDI9538276.1 tetratricopeptide repeat protein [Bacteroidota bacterium]URW78690.1 tetratricopeptide repeat protein [Alkaliflexus sp. Ai-910]HHU00662.1 tetratricopeptide repeat protein [Bacteroidales bacterium]
MSKKQSSTAEQNLQQVETALGRSEQWIEDNQKSITIFVLAFIIAVGGYWGFKKLYVEPRNVDAQKAVFQAQNYFGNDDFQQALDGDGVTPGFLEIIDSYGNTKAGKLAKYYAGISYLNLGQYEEALGYLKSFKTKNPELKAVKEGAIGDCYLELGEKDQALKYYNSAIAVNDAVTTPFFLLKKGMLLEEMGNKTEALKAYTTIKEEYAESVEASQIEKYISRVSL